VLGEVEAAQAAKAQREAEEALAQQPMEMPNAGHEATEEGD
jgi:hypothetical protein